jgi:hypothetical protein
LAEFKRIRAILNKNLDAVKDGLKKRDKNKEGMLEERDMKDAMK